MYLTAWAEKTGLSAPPPRPGGNGSWDEWARSVKIDLAALRQYAQAVYAATDQFVASLDADALAKPLDLSALGIGQTTVGAFVCGIVLQHANHHCGEIACLKGLQGAKGYPF